MNPCQPPDFSTRKPAIDVPPGACDCHAHIFGDPAKHPYVSSHRYTPASATLSDYRAMLAALGIARAVIVQPTIYQDNQVTIDTLAASNGEWRGIARLGSQVSEQELQRLHDLGFRGVRFHPKAGASQASLDEINEVCTRIAPLGWHAQFHLDARHLTELGPSLERLPVPLVIDHMGHMKPANRDDLQHDGFLQLLRWLNTGRAWVKLSAPNRFDDPLPPYPAVAPFAQALVAANPEQLLWGSDWPHSSHAGHMPNDADLLDVLALWAPDANVRQRILVDNPARLYGFPSIN
ncbi:MAG TPA: amidohydrolase family protein [Burkholderiaceae bacterium]|nr:amidohydrolase family protein [Burkholderiaceae bacterium]